MRDLDQQLHGYRHGHELLSASTKLPKLDQDLVDRLSDVAGPLRPDERFEPYITCYPLPSGAHYVLASTWQDFDAPRAGCVRTRSLLIPMSDWMVGVDIVGLVKVLYNEGPLAQAGPIKPSEQRQPLPYVSPLEGLELAEALFLEDRKPIVVFDSSDAEAITLRLLASVWPALRRTFAVSTFALSPRAIGGRSFDLVFAPKDARSRFNDWSGRKIDASKQMNARHRWTREIFDRVFNHNSPSLLRDDALGGLIENGGTEAEFRISLLWNELQEKLETSPNAALGLLDIANSRSIRNIEAIKLLEPKLGNAARQAVTTLSPPEAWRFLLALTDKLKDVRLQLSVAKAIRGAAVQLARKHPAEAISNVEMLSTARGFELLLGAVGDGLADNFDSKMAAGVAQLQPTTFLQLLLLSPSFAVASLNGHAQLLDQLRAALNMASLSTIEDAKRRLLRLLVDDFHAEAASLLIEALDREELLAEMRLLYITNGLSANKLHRPLAERARMIGAANEMRNTIAELVDGHGPAALLDCLVMPVREDIQWVLGAPMLTADRRLTLLRRVLALASASEFKSILKNQQILTLQVLMQDPAGSLDLVIRMLESDELEASQSAIIAMRLIPYANENQAWELAVHALEIVLVQELAIDRKEALEKLLITIGSRVNAPWVVRTGLNKEVPGHIITENLISFDRLPTAIRQRFILAIEDIVMMIVSRGKIDYVESGAAAAANLLWDSSSVDQQAFVRSSATLLPFLLRSYNAPASKLIAASFSSVYRELKKADVTSDFFKFFVFINLDKCKNLRDELIDAFMRSEWQPIDIALAAARSGDVNQILRDIATQKNGAHAIAEINRNLGLIPIPWRDQINKSLKKLRVTY